MPCQQRWAPVYPRTPFVIRWSCACGAYAQLAVLAFVEYMLLHSTDGAYQSKILSALKSHACDAAAMVSLLSSVLQRVSPVDYDRIQFIYSMLLKLGAADEHGVLHRNRVAIDILRQFASSQARSSSGSGSEDNEADVDSVDHTEVADAEPRIPFHTLLADPWKVVVPHVSLHTRLLLCLTS